MLLVIYYPINPSLLQRYVLFLKTKSTRAGWRDAGRDGPHPKSSPGRGPLAAVPPGVRGTLPRSVF